MKSWALSARRRSRLSLTSNLRLRPRAPTADAPVRRAGLDGSSPSVVAQCPCCALAAIARCGHFRLSHNRDELDTVTGPVSSWRSEGIAGEAGGWGVERRAVRSRGP